MTGMETFSLLYPHASQAPQEEPAEAELSQLSELEADLIFARMSGALRFQPNTKHPLSFYTRSEEVIQYRLDIMEDLLNHESLFELLVQLVPELENMKALQSVRTDHHSTDTASDLYSIAELEIYLECITRLYDFFHKQASSFQSEGICSFASKIKSIYEGKQFQTLKQETAGLTHSIRRVKSITVGINLDAQLRPVEAGVVAIHDQEFKSGSIIDKLLRAELKQDEFTCLAPLQYVRRGITPDQAARFHHAVNSTLHQVFKSSLKSWRPAALAYLKANSAFLVQRLDELRFLLGGAAFLKQLEQEGVPICKPKVACREERTFQVKGFYHPGLIIKRKPGAEEEAILPVILNDLEFDERGMIYILTGPNQGGKSVFTQAVGIVQLMFQLGFYVPAQSAVISPVDHIFTHFQNRESDEHSYGRFGEECQRLTNIFSKITNLSLLLMDETFSSTSAAEAAQIAEDVLIGLRAAGCRVIYATHLHDLARRIDQLNEPADGGVMIDSLTAQLSSNAQTLGKRNYKIVRARPEGLSYAQDIAQKYGLTLENLLQTLRKTEAVSK